MRRCSRAAALLLAALLLSAVAAGCGGVGEVDEDPTPLGSGSGGPAVGAATTDMLLDTTGRAIGQVRYDGAYFDSASFRTPSGANPTMGTLTSTADNVTLSLLLISGRPDTPCRFEAALAARDLGATILGDGVDRISDAGLEFHEVWLNLGAAAVRLDCARVFANLGVEVFGTAPVLKQLRFRQVHFVLNSIQP